MHFLGSLVGSHAPVYNFIDHWHATIGATAGSTVGIILHRLETFNKIRFKNPLTSLWITAGVAAGLTALWVIPKHIESVQYKTRTWPIALVDSAATLCISGVISEVSTLIGPATQTLWMPKRLLLPASLVLGAIIAISSGGIIEFSKNILIDLWRFSPPQH